MAESDSMPAYDPQLPHGVSINDLSPEAGGEQQLNEYTSVALVNRGRHTLEIKFSARDYKIPPGLHRMPYGGALHFQKHATVPGTRDAFAGVEQSFIGIIGVDTPDMCEPFSDEECEKFGLRTEALMRDDGDEVSPVAVNAAVATGKVPMGRGKAGGRKGVAFTAEGKTATGRSVDRGEVMSADGESASERIAAIEAES